MSDAHDPERRVGGKPLWLMRALVTDYTVPGEVVYDPCAGSATTLIAAAMEGRWAIGCEPDREAYEAACRRLDRRLAQQDLWRGRGTSATQMAFAGGDE